MSDAVIINIHEDINLVEVIIGSSVMRMASIREYVHQLMLIDRRKGTERCLTCGSTDHQSFRGGCDGRLSALNWDSQLAAEITLPASVRIWAITGPPWISKLSLCFDSALMKRFNEIGQ